MYVILNLQELSVTTLTKQSNIIFLSLFPLPPPFSSNNKYLTFSLMYASIQRILFIFNLWYSDFTIYPTKYIMYLVTCLLLY